MTTAQLKAMQAGKRRASRVRTKIENAHAQRYMQWVKDEAQAHAAYKSAKYYGHEDVEERRGDWRGVMERMPKLPTDSAIQRIRGEA